MSYLFAYSPADTRYWHGKDGAAVNGLPRTRVHDELANSVVYRPALLSRTMPPANAPVPPSGDIEAVVREVTSEEVSHYHEYGWVMLRKLVAPAFAGQMLQAFAELGSLDGKQWPRDRQPALELFRSFTFSERCAANAVKLLGRKRLKGVDVPLRYNGENGPIVNPRRQEPSTEPHGLGGGWSQDACEDGSDRVGELQFCLALNEITPEMGPMRFVNRSHREGPLGSIRNQDGDTLAGGVVGYRAKGDLLAQYPLLPEVLGMSAPEETHYQLGDCTVHHGYCVHGTSRPSTTT